MKYFASKIVLLGLFAIPSFSQSLPLSDAISKILQEKQIPGISYTYLEGGKSKAVFPWERQVIKTRQ